MFSRFLDPSVLAALSGLELIAKTVVDGFVAGLHRSPDFGISHEFTEYRAYSPGDDLRHVDWNVYARTGRAYLKRYRGETNSPLTILFDASNSMRFASHSVSKIDYARYVAASILYLAIRQQRDAAGLIVFDSEVRTFASPSTRQGQLHRLLSDLESAEPHARTSFEEPLRRMQTLIRRRGIVLILSDFYEPAEEIVETIAPLHGHGNEVVLFHVLDPKEIVAELGTSTVLVDLETQARMEVSAEFVRSDYRRRIAGHIAALRDGARRAGLHYMLLDTSRPVDEALREYLSVRGTRH